MKSSVILTRLFTILSGTRSVNYYFVLEHGFDELPRRKNGEVAGEPGGDGILAWIGCTHLPGRLFGSSWLKVVQSKLRREADRD